MNFIKKRAAHLVIVTLAVFGLLGWSLALDKGMDALADNDDIVDEETVDEETLEELYDAVFHRPVDKEGKNFHLGRKLKDVLRDFRNSEEQRYYGALFKAVKSYEEAQRAPGTLTETEKQSHLNLIDSALSNLLAWVATLPDHKNACDIVVGASEAREAIQAAYDRMSPVAKLAAEKGIFNALKQLGKPRMLTIHPKCLRTPTPTVSPSPTVTPTPTPTPTATPTPTP